MTNEMNRHDLNELTDEVTRARNMLAQAEKNLDDYLCSIENNVFDSLEAAEAELGDSLYGRASADCEGSYNCGDESYEQEFIVDDVPYVAVLTCEYNRHDKTYYYIDEHEFNIYTLEEYNTKKKYHGIQPATPNPS